MFIRKASFLTKEAVDYKSLQGSPGNIFRPTTSASFSGLKPVLLAQDGAHTVTHCPPADGWMKQLAFTGMQLKPPLLKNTALLLSASLCFFFFLLLFFFDHLAVQLQLCVVADRHKTTHACVSTSAIMCIGCFLTNSVSTQAQAHRSVLSAEEDFDLVNKFQLETTAQLCIQEHTDELFLPLPPRFSFLVFYSSFSPLISPPSPCPAAM